MKALNYFLFVLFFISNALTSQTLMEEKFQGSALPSGWTISSTATIPDEKWTFYDVYDDMEVYESSTVAQNEWVYLPSFDLKSYSSMFFNFSLWLYNRNSYGIAKSCHTNVMISTNDGVTWEKLWSTDNLNVSEFDGNFLYERIWSLNLTPYCGSGKPDVKLAFQYTSSGTKASGGTTSFAALMRVNVSGEAITSFSNLDNNKLNWYSVPNYQGTYDVYYGPYGTEVGQRAGTLVTGLTGNSYNLPASFCQYTAYIRTNNGSVGEWTKLDFMNNVESIESTPLVQSCQLNWTGDAENFDLEYGIGNFTIGNGVRLSNINSKTYNLINLQPNTMYKVFIKPSCASGTWRSATFFTKVLSVESVDKIKVEVYPNPATSILYFTEALSDLKIFDAGGRAVKVLNQNNMSVNVSKLSNGVYTLIGYNEKSEKITKTFIKK